MMSFPVTETPFEWNGKSAKHDGTHKGYALRYASLGWSVFPCHWIEDGKCSCKKENCTSPGKHPLVAHGVLDASTDPDTIAKWFTQWPQANIAVRCDQFWALDIDLKNSGFYTLKCLIEANGDLPHTTKAHTGGGGEHLLFAYPEGTAIKMESHKESGLDVRNQKGYIMVEPSNHISGTDYVWNSDTDPGSDDIYPIAQAPAWLIEYLLKRTQQKTTAPPKATQSLDSSEVKKIRSALTFVKGFDDRDTWLTIGMALHSTRSEQGYALWVEWSQQSDKYNANDQRRVWASFSNKVQSVTVNNTKFNMDTGVKLGTLFGYAQKAGWIDPLNTYDEEVEQAFDHAEQQAKIASAPLKQADPAIAPFPIEKLNRIADWMETFGYSINREVTQQAVLSLAALATSRRYLTETGDPCHLLLGFTAPTTNEGRYCTNAVYQALYAAGLRKMVRSTRLTTPQAIYKTLMRSPSTLYLTDEYGPMVKFASRQPAGTLEQSLSLLQSLYSTPTAQLDSAEEVRLKNGKENDEQPIIYHPSLSMLAVIGTGQLEAILKTSELARGALDQMLILIPRSDNIVQDPNPQTCPTWLASDLRTLRGLSAEKDSTQVDIDLSTIFQGNAELVPSMTVVKVAVNWNQYYQQLEVLRLSGMAQSILNGGRNTIRRIAAVLAAISRPTEPVIDDVLAQWATQYVVRVLGGFLRQYAATHTDGGKASPREKAMETIIRCGRKGIAQGSLHKYCRAYKGLKPQDRTDLLNAMQADGDIVIRNIQATPSSKPVKTIIAMDFVAVQGDTHE